MLYSIRDVVIYDYDQPVREHVVEVRKQPLRDEHQRCLNFSLELSHDARVFRYSDPLGNQVHHFNLPQAVETLSIAAEAIVEVRAVGRSLATLRTEHWEALESLIHDHDCHEMRLPSPLVEPTRRMGELATAVGLERRSDPLGLARELNQAVHQRFQVVDEPGTVQLALDTGRGDCNDLAHVLLGLLRMLGVPSRFVRGFAHPDGGRPHAWVEVCLPENGWVGFDPVRGDLAGEGHIRVAVGRDAGDVPHVKKVFKGEAECQVQRAVQVHPAEEPLEEDRFRREVRSGRGSEPGPAEGSPLAAGS